MTETFTIDYPATDAGRKEWNRKFGLNRFWAGVKWPERKRAADYWHRLTSAEMARQKVRTTPFQNPVIITFWWNDALDCSNHAAIGKMIEDALKGRIIVDDRRRYVKGVEHYFHDENYIRVSVREV